MNSTLDFSRSDFVIPSLKVKTVRPFSSKNSGHLSVLVALLSLVVFASGCNTLSSLGFGGSSQNKILKPAREISEAPSRSIQAPTEGNKAPLDVYIIDIGDTILLEATDFDTTVQLPGDQVVKPDGYISLGECGRLMVMNKSIEQVEAEAQLQIDDHVRRELEIEFEIDRRQRQAERERERLESEPEDADDAAATAVADLELGTQDEEQQRIALERAINDARAKNKVSARIVNWDSKRIYVLGEVNSPGSFVFIGNETVLDAILEAGGLNANANKHQIIVTRPSDCNSCRTVMQVCYDQVVQLGDTSTNYQLQPGDRVFVPTLTFAEDLKRTLRLGKNDRCPRCADCPRGCDLPEGCSSPSCQGAETILVESVTMDAIPVN